MPWYELILDSNFWIGIFERFSIFAPIVAIMMVMVEAFLPILPLSVFVAINVMAFGFFQGYAYSWIGNVLGSIIVYKVIKRFGMNRFKNRISKSKRLKNIFIWIEKQGFFPIFILLTFPFTPSVVICGISALAGVRDRVFIYSIVFGKFFMILSLSFIGFNLSSFVEHPIKSTLYILGTVGISLLAKYLIGKYEKHLDKVRQKMELEEGHKRHFLSEHIHHTHHKNG